MEAFNQSRPSQRLTQARKVYLSSSLMSFRPAGTKKIDPKFTEAKERYERRHIEPQPSGTYEDLEVGRKTFITHNRKSVNEY